MSQKIIGSAVDGFGGDDVLAALGKSLNGIVNGGSARRGCKGRRTSLKGSNSLFENVLGGVGQSAVDVAGIAETETVGGMLTSWNTKEVDA